MWDWSYSAWGEMKHLHLDYGDFSICLVVLSRWTSELHIILHHTAVLRLKSLDYLYQVANYQQKLFHHPSLLSEIWLALEPDQKHFLSQHLFRPFQTVDHLSHTVTVGYCHLWFPHYFKKVKLLNSCKDFNNNIFLNRGLSNLANRSTWPVTTMTWPSIAHWITSVTSRNGGQTQAGERTWTCHKETGAFLWLFISEIG